VGRNRVRGSTKLTPQFKSFARREAFRRELMDFDEEAAGTLPCD
jgi:hypothetical protein